MSLWYVQSAESDVGPLRPAELLDLVRGGKVVAETMVRKDDSSWFAAREVGGLFEAARRPTIEHFCPDCGEKVGQPPTHCARCIKDLMKTKTKITEHSVGGGRSSTPPSSNGPSDSAKRWLQRRRKNS